MGGRNGTMTCFFQGDPMPKMRKRTSRSVVPHERRARTRPAPAATPAPGAADGTGYLSAFAAIAEAIGRAPSATAAIEDVLGIALKAFGMDVGLLHLLEPGGDSLTAAALRGLPPSIAPSVQSLPVNASLAGHVVRTRRPLHVPDVAADRRIARAVDPALLRAEGLRSFACVPLWASDRVLGTLGVCTRHRRRIGREELRLLEVLGHQIGVALDGARLLREAQARAARAAVLNEIWSIVSSSSSLDTLYEALPGAVRRLLPFDRLTVALIDPGGSTLRVVALETAVPTGIAREDRLPLKGSGTQWARDHRQPRIVADLSPDSPVAADRYLAQAGYRCGIQAPLVARDEVIGTLNVWSLRPGTYGEAEAAALFEVGRLLAVAITNASLLEEARARADRLAALQEIGETIARERDLRRALNVIADRLQALIPHDACGIFLRQEGSDTLAAEVWRGAFVQAEPPAVRLGQGITGWVAQTGTPQLVNDAQQDPRALRLPGTPGRPETLLAAPLRAEDRVLGVVTLARYEELRPRGSAPFDPAELDLLTTFAHQAALAIEKTRLMQEALARAESLAAVNARLRESEAQYRLLTEQANDVIYTRTLDGYITFVNPQVEALVGYRPEELIGQPSTLLVSPETLATVAERIRRMDAGEPVSPTSLMELRHKDGRMVPVEVNVAPLRREGQVVGVLGIIRDISARLEMQRELQRRQRELEALNEVARAITSSIELDRTLDLILNKARDLLHVTFCAVMRLDDADGELVPLRLAGPEGPQDREGEDIRFRLGEGLAGLAALERTPVMSTDILADPRTRPTSRAYRYSLRSALAIPLAVPDRVFGVLSIFRPEPGGFTEAEVRLASAFADQAAMALVNASLYEQTRQDLAQLTALREAVEAVSSELHRGLLLQKLVMSAVRLLGSDLGSIGLYDPEAGHVRLAAVHNVPAELLGRSFGPGEGAIGRLLQTGEPVLVHGYAASPYRVEMPGVESMQGVLSVPIRYQGRLVGTFTVGSSDPDRRFTEREVETLSVFAKHAGIAIENARMFRECQAYSAELEQRVAERTRDLAAQQAFTEGVVAALPLGLYVVDRDLRVVTCNPSGAREAGIEPAQLQGRSILEVLPEARRQAAQAALEDVFARGAPSRREDDFTEGGRSRVLRSTLAPLRGEGGEVTYAILLVEDITDHKRLERQMLAAEKLAAVGSLAAGVAHELNNPLATIAGCAEGLLDRLRDEGLAAVEGIADFREYLRIIEEEAYRCKEITSGLLQFVRDPGRGREPVDLNALVAKALALVSHQPRFRNLTLRREAASAVPPVLGNEGQLRQVFLSLLLNALEATPGQGIVTVRTLTQDEPEGAKVAVEFEDQGTGIAPEHLPRIFEPFFTTKPAGKGTGLGLAICQGIVTDHGGRIDVQSQPGTGSTFRVILPAAPEPAAVGGGQGSGVGGQGTS